MERVSVLCLFLLLCFLSGAELQHKEIIEQDEPESVNVPKQTQPFHSDLDAVLREMKTALAEHRVKIDMLQTLNQEQATKLRVLELKASEVDTLKIQQQAGQVAFSASLLASGSGNVGPFNTHKTLVFKYIFSNIGNAYNPSTGFFTAPVSGAYQFEFYIGAHGHSSHASGVMLVKNGEHIFMAWEQQSNGYGTSANGATLLLEAGDVVFLRLWQNTRIYGNENHISTFSGHLLFPHVRLC
uniref:C1q domain-containing protein n=1 Tax=Neogobius melanostomus TaxID=47308 RepID=A0A8C6UL81_9GOBI